MVAIEIEQWKEAEAPITDLERSMVAIKPTAKPNKWRQSVGSNPSTTELLQPH
jgi:hypothetical protein